MTAALFTEIDHIAIAVNDLEAAIAYYRDVYGAVVDHRELVESDGEEDATHATKAQVQQAAIHRSVTPSP